MYTQFWSEDLKGRDYSEYLDIDERIILEWILKKEIGWEGKDWINIAQDMNQWWNLITW
jgi:hypothetical protein